MPKKIHHTDHMANVDKWRLTKRGYYSRAVKLCASGTMLMARLTWHEFGCEDGWYLTFGNDPQDHEHHRGQRVGWGGLQAAMLYAEQELQKAGLE